MVCGELEGDSADPEAILNPRVLIEVLSDFTESYDRGKKFDFYRQIDSLEEYVLVSQHEPATHSLFVEAKFSRSKYSA